MKLTSASGKSSHTAGIALPHGAASFSKAQREQEVRTRILENQANLRVYARYLTASWDQADDLVQDTTLRALSFAEKFTPGTNFRAWINTIARNLFYTGTRKPWTKHLQIDELTQQLSVPSTQEQNLEFCDFRRAYWELGSDQREALVQVGVNGLSYHAAAVLNKCAIGTIKSRISRARQDLKELMSDKIISIPRSAVRQMAGMNLLEVLEIPLLPVRKNRRDRAAIVARTTPSGLGRASVQAFTIGTDALAA